MDGEQYHHLLQTISSILKNQPDSSLVTTYAPWSHEPCRASESSLQCVGICNAPASGKIDKYGWLSWEGWINLPGSRRYFGYEVFFIFLNTCPIWSYTLIYRSLSKIIIFMEFLCSLYQCLHPKLHFGIENDSKTSSRFTRFSICLDRIGLSRFMILIFIFIINNQIEKLRNMPPTLLSRSTSSNDRGDWLSKSTLDNNYST